MTKDELVDLLNKTSGGSATPPMTKRILSDWIDEDLLDGAKAMGRNIGTNPDWQLTEETIEYAKFLWALRSLGVKRVSVLRLYLWMFGRETHFDLVLKALMTEYSRVMQRYRRIHNWDYERDAKRPIHSARYKKLLARLSSGLDPDLKVAGFEIPSEIAVELGLETISPDGNRNTASLMIEAVQRQGLLPEKLDEQQRAQLEKTFNAAALKGVFANPEESAGSVEEAVKKLGPEHLAEGRADTWEKILTLLYCYLLAPPSPGQQLASLQTAYLKAFRSMVRPEWIVLNLASLSVAAYRSRSR